MIPFDSVVGVAVPSIAFTLLVAVGLNLTAAALRRRGHDREARPVFFAPVTRWPAVTGLGYFFFGANASLTCFSMSL